MRDRCAALPVHNGPVCCTLLRRAMAAGPRHWQPFQQADVCAATHARSESTSRAQGETACLHASAVVPRAVTQQQQPRHRSQPASSRKRPAMARTTGESPRAAALMPAPATHSQCLLTRRHPNIRIGGRSAHSARRPTDGQTRREALPPSHLPTGCASPRPWGRPAARHLALGRGHAGESGCC